MKLGFDAAPQAPGPRVEERAAALGPVQAGSWGRGGQTAPAMVLGGGGR